MAEIDVSKNLGIGAGLSNDFTSQAQAGFSSGIEVAKGLQQLEQQREAAKQARQKAQLAKTDYIVDGLKKAAFIQNPKLRKLEFKRFMDSAAQLEVAINPDYGMVLEDPEHLQQVRNLIGDLSGLPDDARAQAGGGLIVSLSDNVSNGIEQLRKAGEQRSQFMAQQQEAQQKAKNSEVDTEGKKIKATDDVINQATKQVKTELETVKQANKLLDIGSDPGNRKKPFPGYVATVLFAKYLDPESIVRESEAAGVQNVTPGVAAQIFKTIQKAKNGENLSEDQWHQILSLTQMIAKPANESVKRAKEEYVLPNLGRLGQDPKEVQSFFPELKDVDFMGDLGFKSPSLFKPKDKPKEVLAKKSVAPQLSAKTMSILQKAGIDPADPEAAQKLQAMKKPATAVAAAPEAVE